MTEPHAGMKVTQFGAGEPNASLTRWFSIMRTRTSFTLAFAVSAAIVLTGCSTTPDAAPHTSGPQTSTSAESTKEAPKAPDLTGTWKQSNSHSEDSYQEAEISGDVISINWVGDSGETKSIYWIGTYAAPTGAMTPYKWTSTRDQTATQSALLASQDATKDFTFQDDTISYTASLMGTTATIKLKKQ